MRAMVFAVMAGSAIPAILASSPPRIPVLATPRPAVSQVQFYQEGNRLYQEGDFEDALASYLRLVEAGFESGEVYYNIGNTYFKLGELAQSILYYERARRLLPGDQDVQANLDLVRSLTVDEIEPLPRFWLFIAVEWWVVLLPITLLVAVVAASYLVGTGAVLLLILKRGVQVAVCGRRIALASGVVFLLFGLNLAVREFELGRAQEAVVLQPRVDVMSAPLDDETLTVFTVHEGTTVRIHRLSEEWAEVVLEDGRVGWVPVGVLETI
jgi:tetratricopeptide (TPR) repeat protein